MQPHSEDKILIFYPVTALCLGYKHSLYLYLSHIYTFLLPGSIYLCVLLGHSVPKKSSLPHGVAARIKSSVAGTAL